jgi:putative PIN family toxin of toxin-antitoxin system
VRVFLDTNVLVSAFATRGLCADLLRQILARHQLLVGEIVLAELEKALTRKLKVPAPTVREILASLREHEVVPQPQAAADYGIEDPDDAWIVASAEAAEADVLVTGDTDLLDARDRLDLPILDPRAFWNLLRNS